MWNLARKLLLHDRLRFAVAIAGVSVSVMLVLVQVGLYYGFMDTASSIIDASKADLWVGKKGNESFEFATPFDERAYYRVSSVPGVAHTERMLMNFAQFKLADGGDLGVQVVGIETAPGYAPLLAPWNVVAGDPRRLAEPGAIALDRTEYAKLRIDRVGHITEISGVRAEVVALTSGIRSFTTSPIIFTDLRTARSYLPQLGEEPVTYVLVKVAPGSASRRGSPATTFHGASSGCTPGLVSIPTTWTPRSPPSASLNCAKFITMRSACATPAIEATL